MNRNVIIEGFGTQQFRNRKGEVVKTSKTTITVKSNGYLRVFLRRNGRERGQGSFMSGHCLANDLNRINEEFPGVNNWSD